MDDDVQHALEIVLGVLRDIERWAVEAEKREALQRALIEAGVIDAGRLETIRAELRANRLPELKDDMSRQVRFLEDRRFDR